MAWKLRIEANVLTKQIRRRSHFDAKRVLTYLRDDFANLDNPHQVGQLLRYDLWRYRVGNLRIVCRIRDQENFLEALLIKHRSQVYRFLDRI